ncbi:TadE/TadG family type IV pilus assembly protein [Shinella zoogloeoides]|uniref:TadE/TadG family type IV pilus assembly protein n=1 Tax=Shinella zoogloeoides TaxID=352475 RepID=UPI0028B16FD0|nr:TadE/TadG family type IV pilus assembly protein [Shinella zoogloeoides]
MPLDHDTAPRRRPAKGLFRRFLRRRDGATAIEFAILAIPFFVIVFASIETFVAFMGDQLLANATDTMARKIRTGEIRAASAASNATTELQFRTAFCEEIKILMPCSKTEAAKPDKLFLDVRHFDKYSDIPSTVPLVDGDLSTKDFKFDPGGKKTINIVRAYYRWDVITDLVRPILSNIRAADGSRQNYLMVATVIMQNEDYP